MEHRHKKILGFTRTVKILRIIKRRGSKLDVCHPGRSYPSRFPRGFGEIRKIQSCCNATLKYRFEAKIENMFVKFCCLNWKGLQSCYEIVIRKEMVMTKNVLFFGKMFFCGKICVNP